MAASVLHVATRHRRGGAERNVNHFIGWQRCAGLDVRLAVGPDSLPEMDPEGIESIRIPHLVRQPFPPSDLLAVRELRRAIGRGTTDVVHTHQSKAGVIGRLAARGRARLIVHTIHMPSFGQGYGAAPSALFKLAERTCARWTDELVAVGEELRETYLADGIGSPGRFRVIRSVVDLDSFIGTRGWSRPMRDEIRADLGVGATTPVILVAAALEPRKRVGLVVDSVAPRLRRGAFLVVAGDGTDRRSLERLASQVGVSDRVRFLGHVPDLWRVMGAADVLVHAAQAEGVPQVMLQALASGISVVATDVTGLREVAGAPISIARRDGRDLAKRVDAVLSDPPVALSIGELDPWRRESVEAEIGRFHEDLGLA